MAWNVLVHNGALQLHDPGSTPTFLKSQPPGVYTTTRSTNNASCLLLWDRHLARLSQSLKLLSIEMPQLFPNEPPGPFKLNDILQPSLKIGLQQSLQVRRDDEELIITAFVCGGGGIPKVETYKEHKGFEIYVHVSRYLPEHRGAVAHLAVMGPGRSLPNVKHSEWVRTRQVLEHSRPTDVTEVILSNDGDSLLEGMVSNFFVVLSPRTYVTDKAIGHSFDIDGKESWEGIVVQTAPLEGVLPGVLRQLILQICTEEGIRIEEVAPLWKDRHLWKEAFITSSVRFVQSVGSIRRPIYWDCRSEPQTLQEKSWEDLILQAPGHFTQTIQDLVWKKSLNCSVTIDSLLGDG